MGKNDDGEGIQCDTKVKKKGKEKDRLQKKRDKHSLGLLPLEIHTQSSQTADQTPHPNGSNHSQPFQSPEPGALRALNMVGQVNKVIDKMDYWTIGNSTYPFHVDI